MEQEEGAGRSSQEPAIEGTSGVGAKKKKKKVQKYAYGLRAPGLLRGPINGTETTSLLLI